MTRRADGRLRAAAPRAATSRAIAAAACASVAPPAKRAGSIASKVVPSRRRASSAENIGVMWFAYAIALSGPQSRSIISARA